MRDRKGWIDFEIDSTEGNICIALNREHKTTTSYVRVDYAHNFRSKSKWHESGEDKTINAEVPAQLCKKHKPSSRAGKKLVSFSS